MTPERKIKDCKSCLLKAENALNCEMYSIIAKNDVVIGKQCEYFRDRKKNQKEENNDSDI